MAEAAPDRTFSVFAWSAAQSWLAQAIRLGSIIVLARLLAPGEMGVYAFAAALIAVLQLLVGQGLPAALAQRPQLEPGHVSSALRRIILASLLLTLATAAGAGLASFVLHQPTATPVLRALSISFLISGLASIAMSLLRRRLDMRAVAIATCVGEAAGAAVGIGLALTGWGVWSLVARQLATNLAAGGLAWALLGRQTLVRPEPRHYRELAGPARQIAAGNVLVLLRDRLDEVVIGALLGAEALGLYALARRHVEALTSLVPAVIHNSGWPLFASLQNDPAGLRTALIRGQAGIIAVAWPAYAEFAATSPLWAPLILGRQWSAVAPLIVGLSLIAAVRSVVGLQLLALTATGRAGRRLVLEVLATVVVFAAMVAAARFGIVAAISTAAVATSVLAPLEVGLIARDLPTKPRELAPLLVKGLMLSMAVYAAAWAAQLLILPALSSLTLALAAGAVTYGLGLALLFPKARGQALGWLARARQPARGG